MLNEQQNKALTELVNIAFERTATSLSELTGHRVVLDLPHVTVCPIHNVAATLGGITKGQLATIHQIFAGPVAGDALLVLDYESAGLLVDLLTGEQMPIQRLDASAREVLTEIGNILLNACLGMFGNVLQVRFSFSVPRLHVEDLESMLASLLIDRDELRHALVIHARFCLRDSAVTGYLLLVLGLTSLDHLLQEVENWRKAQAGG